MQQCSSVKTSTIASQSKTASVTPVLKANDLDQRTIGQFQIYTQYSKLLNKVSYRKHFEYIFSTCAYTKIE